LLEDKDADDDQSEKGDDAAKADKEPSDDEMMEQLGAFKSPGREKAHKILAREQAKKFAAVEAGPGRTRDRRFPRAARGRPGQAPRGARSTRTASRSRLRPRPRSRSRRPRPAASPDDLKKLAEQTWK
jgi:hypothetical protein